MDAVSDDAFDCGRCVSPSLAEHKVRDGIKRIVVPAYAGEDAEPVRGLVVEYPRGALVLNPARLLVVLAALPVKREKGVAVVYVGEDLDVLLELCDRIMVLNAGRITGIVDARTATKEDIGLMMVMDRKGEQ